MKFKNPRHAMTPYEKERVLNNLEFIENSGLRIHDKRFSIEAIERQIRNRHSELNGEPYMAVIDYLGLVNSSLTNASRNEQVGEVTRRLKMLTNELNIPIIALSQLNRSSTKENREPNLSDLRDSGSVEQDSNLVGFIYPLEEETEYNPTPDTVLSIAKNRSGRTGKLVYTFNKPYTRFEEL